MFGLPCLCVSRSCRGLFIAMVLLLLPVTGSAQVVRVTVVEERTNRLLAEVAITLLSEAGDSVAVARPVQGGYEIQVPRVGRYRLRAQRIGYALTETQLFEVPADDEVTLRVTMGVDAVPLQPLQVSTRPRVPLSPQLADFHERRKLGFGKFLTREEIEARPGTTMSDLLASMPGVRVTHSAGGIPLLEMARSGAQFRPSPLRRARRGGAPPTVEEQFAQDNACPVVLIVDGVQIAPKKTARLDPTAISVEMDAHRFFFGLSATDIEGIEVYRGLSELPGIYASPEAQSCGAVAVWMRRM